MDDTTASPPAPRGPADHEVRRQIVAAAAEHFRHYGYGKTTVSDLAREIGFSKAYIYKFFDSKQAIAEQICRSSLNEIARSMEAAVQAAPSAPDKIRALFAAAAASSLRLYFEERKLHEIAACAAIERWSTTREFEARIRLLLTRLIEDGRAQGCFDPVPAVGEMVDAVYLVLRPLIHPLLLQYSLDHVERGPAQLAALVNRSLAA